MSRVKINVSGTSFEFNRKLLEEKKYHTLTKMCKEAEGSGTPLDFFADRPSDCFAAVLSYYQTGELHMPATVCPKAFRKELNYWGVAETDLDKCCMYRFYTFFDDYETHEKFRQENLTNELTDGPYIPVHKDNKINRLRRRIWNVVDFKENTVLAKIYLVLVFLMVVLCIMSLALSTLPKFRRNLSKCELLEYLDHSENQYAEKARVKFGDPDCSGSVFDSLDEKDLYWEEEYDDDEDYIDRNLTAFNRIVKLPGKTVRLFVFDVLEIVAAVFFTADLLIRLFTCPSLLRFFRSIINIFDILAVLGFYIHITVINIEKEHKYSISWIRLLEYLQIFRVMRLFRIVRNVRASRVLTFSLRQNVTDMTLLALLVMIGVSTSASLIYFIEDRETIESIPVAWYWAMITLTTVGYGDVAPKSGLGRLFASFVAICGVLLLAITVPMFVNNFLTLYQYSCLDEIIKERKQMRRKFKGAVNNVTTVVPRGKTEPTGDIENNNEHNQDGLPGVVYTSYKGQPSENKDKDCQSIEAIH